MPRVAWCLLLVVLLSGHAARASESAVVTRPWTPADRLGDLARQYGVSETFLRQANPGLDSDPAPREVVIPPPPGGWPRHQVARGETLWALARRYGVPVDELRQVNGLAGDGLATGQELQIPRVPPPGTSTQAPPAWLAVTLPDGRKGWVPGSSVLLPAPAPLGRADLVALAWRLRGTPYRYGGSNPDALDCSGFVQEVFRMGGHPLPRLADEQFRATTPIPTGDLEPGDLVFFTTDQPGPSHVGIYTGEGRFLHASSSRGVTEDRLDSEWFAARFLGGRRPLPWAAKPDQAEDSAAKPAQAGDSAAPGP